MSRAEVSLVHRARRCGRLAAAALGSLLALLVPAIALAHPLGNFTVNHYAGIRVEPGRIVLDVVIDQAEIPTFQEKLRIDTDGDGMVSDAEAESERLAACPRLTPQLSLTVDGRRLSLDPVAAGLSFPPGAAGLETMRLVCTFTATPPTALAPGASVAFSDRSWADRIGWHEMTVIGSGVTIAGEVATATVSGRLTAYPASMLAHPLDVRSVAFTASPGGPTLPPPLIPDASPLPALSDLGPIAGASGAVSDPKADEGSAVTAIGGVRGVAAASDPSAATTGSVPGGVGAEVSGLLETHDLTPPVLLGSLIAAMALGAGHALTPGHGKTIMGAYLVGTRGGGLHAIALGLSVTVSHTLGILVLAAIVVGLRGMVSPEAFNRVAPVASGVLVLGIGAALLAGQLRSRRDATTTHRVGAHPHGDANEPATGHPHPHGHEHTLPSEDESHGRVEPSIGWRSLFALGLAGGIIPSTNALIILLASVATGRAVYGLVLVIAFGLGMAVVLAGVGLGLVFARDRMGRLPALPGLGRAAGLAPLMAGVIVVSLGIYLTGQAVGVGPTL